MKSSTTYWVIGFCLFSALGAWLGSVVMGTFIAGATLGNDQKGMAEYYKSHSAMFVMLGIAMANVPLLTIFLLTRLMRWSRHQK